MSNISRVLGNFAFFSGFFGWLCREKYEGKGLRFSNNSIEGWAQ
jgi:hypothetical protein